MKSASLSYELPFVQSRSASLAGRREEWVAGRSIVANGVRVGIRTNTPDAMDRIFQTIPNIWKVSSARCVGRLFSLRVGSAGLVRGGRLRHQLYEDERILLSSRDLDSVLEILESQLKMYLAEQARDRVYVHAGAVGWRGRAIIIPGYSFSGKTSLVAELVRAGATYYSDEYAAIDKHGRVHAYPVPLAIREPGSYEQKKYHVDELGGSMGSRPLPVGLVLITQYKGGGSWRPRSLSPGQAMLELLANTIPARRRPELAMAALQKVVLEALVFKSIRGEAAETARLILDT